MEKGIIYLIIFSVTCLLSISGCVSGDSPQAANTSYNNSDEWPKWPDDCEFFTPFRVNYFVSLLTTDLRTGAEIPLANVTCKIIGYRRLMSPIVQDSCYTNITIDTILNGMTNASGFFDSNFSFTYSSVADYFILEITSEKNGYNKELYSLDKRWFYYNNMKFRSNNPDPNLPRLRDIKNNLLMQKKEMYP